ncbi:TPA: DNA gyrase subunit A [Candidatus Uhrbacteria bacterium]|nr:DNA gyrase subunit A [Candidatus Uhrbacteria bacterium]
MPTKKPTTDELPLPDENLGRVEDTSIVSEMETSYLDYAMSVIVQRALPDVRDGLKPVQRRILYSMWQSGLRANAKFKKCATVVGDVLGKYHPHGDSSVYAALVRMAQDFSLRYPLVRGQGNFGSIDGDDAAAYRYTEAKLEGIAEEVLTDIEKETVDFAPNYDGSHKEPRVLPSKLPTLLLDGTLGIAVGMATSIPPHNLTELCLAIEHLIEHPEAGVEDLMEFVKGPDFPVGGILYSTEDIRQMYASGRGGIVARARTEIVEQKGGYAIIVSEIPYMVNKASLVERIAALVQEKKIEGIRDLRDESNKKGIRVVIELKKDAYPKKVLNRLFQLTQLQETFHGNFVALVGGLSPRLLTLKNILEEHVKHREEVIRRRTQFDLDKARARTHILEGLRIAIAQIDKVIETIKKSKDQDEARVNLMKKFKLSEIQANAILEMQLRRLANLERLKIEEEYKEKQALMKELEGVLKSPVKVRGLIKTEMKELREKYGDARRTEIVKHGVKDFRIEDVIPDAPTVVMITRGGYIKRLPPDTFKAQARGGKGVSGQTLKEEDAIDQVFTTSTHKDLLFFTNRGRVFKLKAYDVPEASRTAKGQALVNFLQLAPGELITTALSLSDLEKYRYLMMVTSKATIKKVALDQFENVRKSGLMAIKLNEGDTLEWVKPTTGDNTIMLVTSNGQAIRFEEDDVRAMGRAAAGVRGIRLKGDDSVVGMAVVPVKVKKDIFQFFVLMQKGYGKRTPIEEYKIQGRGGSGIKTANITSKTGPIVSARLVQADDPRDLLVVSDAGQVIRTALKSVSVLSRATQGVKIMRFKKDADSVATATLVGGGDWGEE